MLFVLLVIMMLVVIIAGLEQSLNGLVGCAWCVLISCTLFGVGEIIVEQDSWWRFLRRLLLLLLLCSALCLWMPNSVICLSLDDYRSLTACIWCLFLVGGNNDWRRQLILLFKMLLLHDGSMIWIFKHHLVPRWLLVERYGIIHWAIVLVFLQRVVHLMLQLICVEIVGHVVIEHVVAIGGTRTIPSLFHLMIHLERVFNKNS